MDGGPVGLWGGRGLFGTEEAHQHGVEDGRVDGGEADDDHRHLKLPQSRRVWNLGTTAPIFHPEMPLSSSSDNRLFRRRLSLSDIAEDIMRFLQKSN